MEIIGIQEDKIWETVLQALAKEGRLLRYQKLPRHEMNAYLKAFGKQSSKDLKTVFHFVQIENFLELEDVLKKMGDGRVFCMLHTLIGCMKCWVETESPNQSVRRRWKIANS